jgi:hypothetical protein
MADDQVAANGNAKVKWGRVVVKGAVAGGLLLMARSKNRVARSVGRVGGLIVVPRMVKTAFKGGK